MSNPSTSDICLLLTVDLSVGCSRQYYTVTFDQPLYAKATKTVLYAGSDSLLGRVIVRLGGFHFIMSFMGLAGHIMAGSGMEYLREAVYARNSIVKMLSGASYARELRANFLSYWTLVTLLLESPSQDNDLKTTLNELYSALLHDYTTLANIEHSEPIVSLCQLLHKTLLEAADREKLDNYGFSKAVWLRSLGFSYELNAL